MRCFFTLTIAMAFAVGLSATSWSQTGGAGGAGGGAGTSGASASGGAGTTGANGAAATGGAAATTGGGSKTGVGGTATTNRNGRDGNVVPPGSPTDPGTPITVPFQSGGAANGRPNGNTGVNNNGNAGVNNNRNPGANNNRNAGLNNANRNNVNGRTGFQGTINQTPFFSDPGVRQQLNLNNNQFNSMNTAWQNAYGRYNQALTNLNNSNLTDQQRALQQQQLETQFNQNFAGSLNNNNLYNPQMRARLNQLNRQFQGVNAFNDPTVQQQLNLTQDQTRQLRTLQANWRQQMQQFGNSGTNGTAADPAQWTQLQQQLATQLNGVLTPAQQQIWSQMTGQTYMFSPNAYFNDTTGLQNGTAAPNPATNGTSSIPATGNVRSIPATGGSTSVPATGTTAPANSTPATAQGTQGGTVR